MSNSDTVAIWKALADPTRREILDLLRDGPRTTGAIAAAFSELSRFAIMKHLRVLEAARLVLVRRKGRERWNHLNAVPLREVYERWVSTLDDRWATSMLDIGRIAAQDAREQRSDGMNATHEITCLAIAQEHRIAADPATVYSVLTTRTGDWWVQPFRLLDGDADIRLDARPGGALGEYAGDSFALWGVVTACEPNRTLELTGSCGMAGPAHGVFRFSLEQDGDGTVLSLSHEAIGTFCEDQFGTYDGGWNELIGNLRRIAETGDDPR